ncbi:hypothetical protein KGQ20_13615 [Catenulispora sp. NF23]|uniref:Uncharacterized protein n=1 Tax=Catenulispora pinistramenti TaxID=2705254 RepID=A0ABS5L6Z9_9ACTN|nr:hypothetical protein [Catenulispora pinistramenti]MBS2533807.1 hypothetical protein [Catenulispora pinistramenti]MBS2553984.1 hypothetical protein [Catenulispora pinistramenti]
MKSTAWIAAHLRTRDRRTRPISGSTPDNRVTGTPRPDPARRFSAFIAP